MLPSLSSGAEQDLGLGLQLTSGEASTTWYSRARETLKPAQPPGRRAPNGHFETPQPCRRVHARLACRACLPEEDLCPDDARPLLAQGGAGRRGRAWTDRLDVPVELLDGDSCEPEDLVAALEAEAARA